MAETTTQQQIVREAPDIEAYKLKLLQQSQALAYNNVIDDQGNVIGQRTPLGEQLPEYKVAGFSDAQLAAIKAAEDQGVGAFSPYMQNANKALTSAYGTTAEAADILRGADTRAQFTDAQRAMQQAGGAAANMTAGLAPVSQGLGYLDAAGRRALASDTSARFNPAYQDIETGLGSLATAQNMAAQSSQANLAPATEAIGQGIGGLNQAQQMAMGSNAADFGTSQAMIGQGLGQGQQAVQMASRAAQAPGMEQGVDAMYGGALASAMATNQPGFGQAEQALSQGIGTLGGAQQAYDPSSAQSFMDPYRQQVIDETMRQINRQGAIAQQGLAAQAVRAGAFGGEREGVQRAEMERNLMDQKASTIANLLSQGYSQAQAQSMASFEQQQQRQMQAGQGIGQLGSQQAQVAAQQAGLGQNAAQQLMAAGQGQVSAAAQQAGLGQNAAQLAAQQAGLGVQAGTQVGQQAAQQAQLGQAAAGLYGNLAQNQVAAGQGLGQLGVQQAQLGQGAAGQFLQAGQQYGNMASQQGALAGQEAAINQNISNLLSQQAGQYGQMGGQIANIYGQQGQQMQNLGQGIGQLAGQQFGIGAQQAQGLGQMAGQLGQLGVQQGALGQTAQALQQGDINFLYNVGQSQQAFNQQTEDAKRANTLQKVYAPYQQAGFLSDIYKGAPSSQMSTQVASQPTASPFQQAVGVGLGAVTTAAGAKKLGVF